MMRSLILAAMVCGLPCSIALAGPLGSAVAHRIDADVDALLTQTHAPSAVIAIVQDDAVVYRKAYGLRDREQRLAARVDTRYEIGSITKQFTAAAILQLQERGKLDIDDKASKYQPEAPHADEVTLRQLLSHTSGLPDYFDGPDIDRRATEPASFAAIMARVAGKPLDFAPGSRMAYSNTGYIMLGRIVEIVSHESYRDYVRKHLLEPAGMKHTTTVASEAKIANMAVGYREKDGGIERAPTIADSFGWAAGNLVSTVDDVARWGSALADGRIVSAASYRMMTTATPVADGSSDYGLGLFVDTVRGQPRIGHTGGSFGFTTASELFPKQRVRIIAFTNLVATPEPGERITNLVFDDLFPAIAAAADRPAAEEDADITTKARAFFRTIQTDDGHYDALTPKLADKLKHGLAGRFAREFSPYGSPRRLVFKGRRSDNGLAWYDYVVDFGLGSRLRFGIGLDGAGKIASVSFG